MRFDSSGAVSAGMFDETWRRLVVIVEAKGRENLDVPLKMARLRQWCEDMNRVQSAVRYDFVYVDEESFARYHPATFQQLLDGFRKYKDS